MSDNRNAAASEQFLEGSSPVVNGSVNKSSQLEALVKAFVAQVMEKIQPGSSADPNQIRTQDLASGSTSITPLSEAIPTNPFGYQARGSDHMRVRQQNRNSSSIGKSFATDPDLAKKAASKALCKRYQHKQGVTSCSYCFGRGWDEANKADQGLGKSNQARELQSE
jgi:hypothetical protein